MKATYIDIINRFWAENRRTRFAPSEALLYLYLLNEANAARWEMPIAVPTEIICAMLGLSKSSVHRAREALSKRGMIQFTPGKRRVSSPLYSIGACSNGTIAATTNSTTKEAVIGPTSETTSTTTNATTSVTSFKDIEKDIDTEEDKEKDKKVVPSLSALSKNRDEREETREIEELKPLLEADKNWLAEVECRFPGLGILPLLSDFFSMLRLRGETRKTISDTRSHFVNWINKTQNYEKNKSNTDRRATPAANCRQKDYDAPFIPAR
jgi:hypothetical protein